MSSCSPCENCPFRSDIDFWLTPEKVRSILDALQGDGNFPCHKTTAVSGQRRGRDRACLGAAIFLEHVRPGGLRANLAFRVRESFLKEFHRDELDMDAAVFTELEAFVEAKTKPFSQLRQASEEKVPSE